MSNRPSLFGDDVRQEVHNLFFAVLPDARTAACITALADRLREQHGLKSAPLEPGRFHVSMHGVGDYSDRPEAIIARATAAAREVRMPRFSVTFDRVVSFRGRERRRPLAFLAEDDAGELQHFHHALGKALQYAGFGRFVEPRFTPHMTLLYDAKGVPEQSVEPITWTVSEFVLIDSLVGQKRHERLANWPLDD